jgi:AcrR family transcriptional regulator
MRKRAEDMAETRQRIIEATVRLHGTLGPAATTIAGIAEEAGVTRLTVYRHFPDDHALFDACSSHWLGQQVLPDPQRWGEVADPVERLRVGLADLYRFYRDGESMLRLVYRDKAELPEEHRRRLDERDAQHRAVLLEPFPVRGSRRGRVQAVIGHAVSFWTWQSLCADHGLTNREAVDAMVALVTAVAGMR